jgi:hypothetical protein
VIWYEIGFGSLLVVVLITLSIYYGRQQLLALRRLRQTPDLPDEEMRYERSKAYRRIISCSGTLLLAAMLIVLLVYGLPVQQIADQREGFPPGMNSPFAEEDIQLVRIWGWTLIAFLLVLMAVLTLAGIDLIATRRYGLRQYRKLQADRRAMIQRQANRMRRERNGHG